MEFMKELFFTCGYAFLIICMIYVIIGFVIDLIQRAKKNEEKIRKYKRIIELLQKERE